MAKKPSLMERLGLVERGAQPETPPLTPEELAALEANTTKLRSLYPNVEVDTSEISGNDVLRSIYAQGNFSDETSLFRIQKFIESLPKEMPTATKMVSIGGILAASNIDIYALIDDGQSRESLLLVTKDKLKEDNARRQAEREAHIEQLREAIAEAERQMAEDKQATEESCDIIEKELEVVIKLLEFADGVLKGNEGGK